MLLEEIMKGYVIPTEYTRKLTVDGITQSYQVYQIRLDRLYYNDQNDRIATWINKYKEENNIVDFSEYNDEYNKIIEGFICESNPKAIEKTKNNIELVGQREPGVVLNDGRIIDGNRRYTCLRKIHEKNHNINHFEAVILDRDIKENKKAIKLLELSIQHGEEGKVDYNPIDRLVGLYNDVIKNELITIDEYQKTVNEARTSINKKIEQAKLMVEFLEFIDAPEKFYIARDLELDGPLGEIPSILNKMKTDEEKENLKLIIFTNLLMKPKGDITRFIRKIKKVVDSEHVDDFIEEQLEFTEKTAEKIEELEGINSKVINKNIRSDELLQENMVQSLEKFEIKAKKDIAKMKPLQDLQKFYIILENLDVNLIKKMSIEERKKLDATIDLCKEELENISYMLKEEK
ncbi:MULTISPECIES: hypothetical protein [Enterococcus]|uniref:ParB/Sulfiredoxin domain-containing protein n=2 Tax=Enterococcus faecium TaxID=1352 RepID=A0AB74CQ34_ENTFC|nr:MULTISPECIES: hypothetical protein [Enterococcus]EGP5286626.1 hypothetical protein [Enterococcus faecium]EMF0142190.1 hypothetical protein [Enterococcus hirae]EMF0480953.1 hypothetical protein [Enterococcus faecium]MBD9752581.1 hypothetical protein [Enterococcus faecium]MBE9890846.1 hypothetical protein [Enterococcus faecium]